MNQIPTHCHHCNSELLFMEYSTKGNKFTTTHVALICSQYPDVNKKWNSSDSDWEHTSSVNPSKFTQVFSQSTCEHTNILCITKTPIKEKKTINDNCLVCESLTGLCKTKTTCIKCENKNQNIIVTSTVAVQ